MAQETVITCDACGKRMDPYEDSLEAEICKNGQRLIVKVVRPSEHDICNHCAIDAINTLDDRPKAAP